MAIEEERLEQAEEIIDYEFAEQILLEDALTHSSAGGPGPSANERLETLGDAVITLIITETLFLLDASADQGAITTAKSALVSTHTLATISRESGLTECAMLGKGVKKRVPGRIGANIFEAVIGAVYLDGGIEAARDVILGLFGGHIHDPSYSVPDPKSRLQHTVHERFGITPSYEVVGTSGPPHRRTFRVRVVIAGRGYPEAEARSKKAAERKAADFALDIILGDTAEEEAPPAAGKPSPE